MLWAVDLLLSPAASVNSRYALLQETKEAQKNARGFFPQLRGEVCQLFGCYAKTPRKKKEPFLLAVSELMVQGWLHCWYGRLWCWGSVTCLRAVNNTWQLRGGPIVWFTVWEYRSGWWRKHVAVTACYWSSRPMAASSYLGRTPVTCICQLCKKGFHNYPK